MIFIAVMFVSAILFLYMDHELINARDTFQVAFIGVIKALALILFLASLVTGIYQEI